MLGAIEAGGTKFVCGVGSGPDDLVVEQFPTKRPEETLPHVIRFLRETGGTKLEAVGIGSFGPVDLDLASPSYGRITSTPKVGWNQFDLAGTVATELRVPVTFDTDVNASLLGEARWGSVRGLSSAVYLTIGTGVGGGALVDGHLVHGLIHPEIGHVRFPHDWERDPFAGFCPFHGDCFEGMASGPALEARWGRPGRDLEPDHQAWSLEARYIALGIVNVALVVSPQRIVLGGGVMQNSQLFPLIRSEFSALLNGYLRHRRILDEIDQYIVPPQLGSQAGVLGALLLAEQALKGKGK